MRRYSASPESILEPWGDVVYAHNGRENNVVWRSVDSGTSWQAGGHFGSGLWRVAVAPSEPATLVATSLSRDEETPLMAVSHNAGITQQVVDGGPWWALESLLAIDRTDPHRIYAAHWDGRLMTSGDEGATWSQPARIRGTPTALLQSPADPDVLYVGTSGDGAWCVTSES